MAPKASVCRHSSASPAPFRYNPDTIGAEVGRDHTARGGGGIGRRRTPGEILIGQAVKTVTAKAPRLPDPGQGETVHGGIMARVEDGVEAQDLWQSRSRGAKGGNRRPGLGLL